jgi:hypothetical protein
MKTLWRRLTGRSALLRTTCAALLMLCAALVMAGQAQAIDVNPAVIEDLARVEKPATIELPTVLHDDVHPLSHPDFGSVEPAVVDNLKTDASSVGEDVTKTASETASDDHSDKLIRDCVKKGLEDVAWDIGWANAEEQTDYSPKDDFEHRTMKCFETWLEAEAGELGHLVNVVANQIGHGAEAAVASDNDLAGLADWLQVVNYYYIEY